VPDYLCVYLYKTGCSSILWYDGGSLRGHSRARTWHAKLTHCLLLTLSPAHTVSCSHRLLLTLSPAHTVSCSHCLLLTLSPAHTVSCSHRLLLTPSPAHTVSCSHCLLLTLTPAHTVSCSRHKHRPRCVLTCMRRFTLHAAGTVYQQAYQLGLISGGDTPGSASGCTVGFCRVCVRVWFLR